MFKKSYYILIISIAAAFFVSGCATQAPYFKLDSSLTKDIRNFGGAQYIPLAGICDLYSLNYKWDSFIRTATVGSKSGQVVLRADSNTMLFDGQKKKLDRPVILQGGEVFVPVSFVRNYLGPMIVTARTASTVSYARPPEPELPKKFTIKTIVIDAGHGGKDPGAVGRRVHIREKEKTLYLARKLKGVLEAAGIRVIMTRDSDTFVSLQKRAQIANKSGADLFVSVHLNASRSRLMRGFECYYLSNATDDNARALEAFENASLRLNDTASLEHSEPLDKTLWDMTLTENRLESVGLAGYICKSIDRDILIADRGIRSARFYVLKYTRMPSVLVEAGYISNKYDELKLKDPAFLNRMANTIGEGILRYKQEYERTEGFTKS